MRVAVVGVGTTGYRRRQSSSLGQLVASAARAAIADAGLTREDVDGLILEGAIFPPSMSADLVAQAIGITPRFSAQWLVGGAGLVAAPALAASAIESDRAEVVVVVHGARAANVADPYRYHADDPWKAALEVPMGWYGQAVYFAAMARRYGHEHGPVEGALEEVALAARAAAQRTPGASKTDQLNASDYRNSPFVSEPLRAADCCLISEGASAYVVTGLDRARDLAHPPAVVAACEVATDNATQTTWFTQRDDLLQTAAVRSGAAAFARAGLSQADVDLVELYDCFSITPLLQLEDLGFCERGAAPALAESGGFRLGGALPLNTHGGLLAYGFCLGISHLIEAVEQIRGARGDGQVRDAEVALVGGLGAPHHATTILTADR